MVSKFDVIRAFELAKEKHVPTVFYLSEDENSLYDSETNEFVCSVETYIMYLRKKLHCDFESLYYNEASLDAVFRCRECGTVIFGGDDERYDPDCKCPTCCNDRSVSRNGFWTADEIEKDPKKKSVIEFYEKIREDEIAAEKRRQARGGLYDWQVFKKDFYGKKYSLHIEMNNYKSDKWYSVNASISFRIGEKDGMGYIVKHNFTIPLTPYALYLKLSSKFKFIPFNIEY